jgi:hypothetical protein
MANLVASGTYPFVQFQPSETSGIQHTDQEYTDTSGNSYLFRMYNAEYNSGLGHWNTLAGGGLNAYATVQNPDGSIHYFWNGGSSTWSAWQGSDNNTIYNSVDYGLTASGGASLNNAALVSLFTGLNNAPGLTGGFARIPQYNFPVVAVVYVSGSSPMGISVPDQVIIQGLGTGGQGLGASNYHFTISDPSGATMASALFVAEGNHSIGGTEFRNLAFEWNGSASYAGDTAINVGFAATLVYRCTFTNCPTAVNFAGYSSDSTPDSLGSVMRECQVKYLNGPANATCVILAGQQTGIMGPSILLCQGAGDEGPAGCTGVAIGGGLTNNEHNIIDGVHFTNWATCVDYADMNGAIVNGSHSGCQYTTIAHCEMDGQGVGSTYPHAGACINLTTYSDTGNIYGQNIVGNSLSISQNSANSNPVILIDTGALGPGGVGGPNTNVSSIDLIGNIVFSNITSSSGHSGDAKPNTYGIQINAGDSIRVIGGKIGNMGAMSMVGNDGSANICISGNPGSVIIDGVDLRPTYVNAGGGSNGSAASEYALLVSGALSTGPIQVRNCDMTGFSASPVGVTGSITVGATPGRGPLYITDCPGYNDQNTVINTRTNLSTGTAYAAYDQGSNHGTSYYGPSLVVFTVGTSSTGTFQINNGTAQTLLANQVVSVFLATPYDTIQFNAHLPSAILWTGR